MFWRLLTPLKPGYSITVQGRIKNESVNKYYVTIWLLVALYRLFYKIGVRSDEFVRSGGIGEDFATEIRGLSIKFLGRVRAASRCQRENIQAISSTGDFKPELLSAGNAIIHYKIIVIDPSSPNPALIFGSNNIDENVS